ncbi:MAG: GcrA family cell cycle regulator [Nitratireductor sp.]
MAWTDDRVEVLRKLWADGLSASQIAAELGGVTRNAVIGKVHRLGLSGRAKTSNTGGARTKRASTRTASSYAKTSRARANGTGASAPAAKQQIIVDIPMPESKKLDLLSLTDSTCKWPTGDPQENDFSFCGAKPREDDPYCEYHCRLAYQPASDRRGKKAPQRPMQTRLSAS